MDVEIVKKDGQSFRLSDYGVVQDFVVHSIERSVVRDPIDGRSGLQDYGVEFGDRTIEVPMIFKASDLHDYAHLRDELYGILDDSESFYIREMRRPKALQYDFVDFGQKPKWEAQTDNEYVNGKQYQVRLNNTLTPDQRYHSGEVSIEFVTSGIPYAETVYTTLELHDTGFEATAEKYGLVDNIDVEKVKYRFSPDIETRYLSNITFDYGLISGTGAISASQAYTYSTNFIKLTPGVEYTFIDKGDNPRLSYWWFSVYNDDGNFIERFSSSNNPNPRIHKFVAKGSNLRIMTNAVTPLADNVIRPEEIGVDVLPTISGQAEKTTFNVYNAGNVAIEPESMELRIRFRNARNLGEIKLVNKTTGETFSTTADVGLTRHFEINGMVVKSGAKNIFRDTNRRFIRLAPGINELEFSGATFDSLDFNFKYLYK